MLGPSIIGLGVPMAFAYSLLVRKRAGWSGVLVTSTLLSALELAVVVLVLVADLLRE